MEQTLPPLLCSQPPTGVVETVAFAVSAVLKNRHENELEGEQQETSKGMLIRENGKVKTVNPADDLKVRNLNLKHTVKYTESNE